MRDAQATSRMNRLSSRLAGWLGFSLMVAMLWLGQSGSSQARLDPYFVVRGDAFGSIQPRVLFVLDTSGSMTYRATTGSTRCSWADCESEAAEGTIYESRLSLARRAVQSVIDASEDAADFALMTFVQNEVQSSGSTPMW